MTRWLTAAKTTSGAPDKTDTTDKTHSHFMPTENTDRDPKQNSVKNEVLSHLSVLSGRGKADFGNCESDQPLPSLNDPGALKIEFEERAAILEFDGGHSRQEAEGLAKAEVYGTDIVKGISL